MTLKCVENWQWIVRHSWSFHLMLLAAALSGLEVTIQVMLAFEIKPPIPSVIFASLSGLVTVAATIARFISQQKPDQ